MLNRKEINGLIGYNSSIILFILFLIWGFTPDELLHRMGITYYPNKSWAIVLPSIIVSITVYLIFAFIFVNMIYTFNSNDKYLMEGTP